MNLLFIIIGFFVIILFLYLDWRTIVKITLYVVLIEGIIRKWVLPQASELVYFLKDIILLIAYLKYFSKRKRIIVERKKGLINTLITIALLWGIVQAFNTNLGSPIVGFLGLKAYFFYVPLLWIIRDVFNSEEELYKFVRVYLLTVIPISLLAVIQYFSPINSPLNIYAGGVEANATVGENVRVTGPFPYISGLTVYLFFCFSLLIPLLSYPQPKKWVILSITELTLIIGISFMTGSRGVLVIMIAFSLLYLIISSLKGTKILFQLIKQYVLLIAIIIMCIPFFFDKAIDNFLFRLNNSDSLIVRITEPLTIRLDVFEPYGIGASHQGVPALSRILNLQPGKPLPPLESEMLRVVIEIGTLGFLIWYALRITLMIYLFRVFLKLRNVYLFSLTLSAFLYHLINLPGQVVFGVVNNLYYWFLVGLVYCLLKLEKNRNEILSSEGIKYEKSYLCSPHK